MVFRSKKSSGPVCSEVFVWLILPALSLGVIAFTGSSSKAQTTKKDTAQIFIGGSSAGGPTFVAAVATSKAIEKYAPNIRVTIMETGGGMDNWSRVKRGLIPIGVYSTGQQYAIYNGVGVGKGIQDKDIRGIVPLIIAYNQIIVRADAKISDVRDLKGRRINPGASGSQTEVDTRNAIKALGIEPNYYIGGYDDAIERFKNRQIDGFVRGGPVPDARVIEVATSIPVKLIGFTPDQWEKVKVAVQGAPRVVIPAKAYEWLDKDVITFGIIGALGTKKDAISEDVAYQIVRAWDNGYREFVAPAHSALALVKDPLAFLIETYMSPLHIGVIKYLREKGRTIPSELVPPEAK